MDLPILNIPYKWSIHYVALHWFLSFSITNLHFLPSFHQLQIVRKDFSLFIFSRSSCPLTLTTMVANQVHGCCLEPSWNVLDGTCKPSNTAESDCHRKALQLWPFVVFTSADWPFLSSSRFLILLEWQDSRWFTQGRVLTASVMFYLGAWASLHIV
jgi:hypothetical protein